MSSQGLFDREGGTAVKLMFMFILTSRLWRAPLTSIPPCRSSETMNIQHLAHLFFTTHVLLNGSVDGKVVGSFSWSTTLVQTEISQQLL